MIPAPPEGFRFAACDAGIAGGGRPDLWLAVADEASPAAAILTKNEIVAAPVALVRAHLERSGGLARAILVNAGCANAGTGPEGDADAARCAELVAETVGCPVEQVLLFSTGVIGRRLPVERIEAALPALATGLARTPEAVGEAARAILTTDTRPKLAARSLPAAGGEARLLGLAKGAGMIRPDMATMLAFLFSDLDFGLDPRALLLAAADRSFHRITVDGDTSTNDAVLLWTSRRRAPAPETDAITALDETALELAKAIARDGEGATKLIEVRAAKAFSPRHARAAAFAIAESLLVKTAVHGGDPNWGRILAAAGRSGVDLDTRKLRVGIGPVCLFEDDRPQPEREAEAARHLEGSEVLLWIELGTGECEDSVFTCDLSADYVRINADYRS